MSRRVRSHLTYANVMSTIACFGVLATGTAYAANTVFSSDIVDRQVKTDDLAYGAVTTPTLADGSVASEKIADETILSRDVRDESLLGRDIFNNTLKGADIDESTLSNVGPVGGDLSGAYPNPTVAVNAVGQFEFDGCPECPDDEINDGAVDGTDVHNASIASRHVQAETLTGSDIKDHSISSQQLGVSILPVNRLDVEGGSYDVVVDAFGMHFDVDGSGHQPASYGRVIYLDELNINGSILPGNDSAQIGVRDSGSGVTQVVARFGNGDVDVLAAGDAN